MLPRVHKPATQALAKDRETPVISPEQGRRTMTKEFFQQKQQEMFQAQQESHHAAMVSFDMGSLLAETYPLMQEKVLLSSFPKIEWDDTAEYHPGKRAGSEGMEHLALSPRKKLRSCSYPPTRTGSSIGVGLVRSRSFSSNLSGLDSFFSDRIIHSSH
jgi:hypothetical protein